MGRHSTPPFIILAIHCGRASISLGYKYYKNDYSVEYGCSYLARIGRSGVRTARGSRRFQRAHTIRSATSRRLSLNLAPDVPEGNYALVITMADKVGGQMSEARAAFRIQK